MKKRLLRSSVPCLIAVAILLSIALPCCAGAEGKSEAVNILVLGTDEKLEGTKDIGRSDSIFLFSLDADTGTIRSISFERSIMVYVPQIYEKDMLTHVYHWAGAEGVVSTIEDYFDVSIDGYLQFDYRTFTELVDMIGGVDIELTAYEAEAINGGWAEVYMYVPVEEGINHLYGHDALEYCRLRMIDDNYMRQRRQYNTAVAMYRQVKTLSFSEVTAIINEFLPRIQADISPSLLMMLTSSLPKFMHSETPVAYLQVPEKEYDSKHTMKYFSFDVQKERIKTFLQEGVQP